MAIIGNVAIFCNVYFFIDVWHQLLKVPHVATNVNLVTLTRLMLVGEEVARLSDWLTIFWVTRVNYFGELVSLAEGGCRWHLEHSVLHAILLSVIGRNQMISGLGQQIEEKRMERGTYFLATLNESAMALALEASVLNVDSTFIFFYSASYQILFIFKSNLEL